MHFKIIQKDHIYFHRQHALANLNQIQIFPLKIPFKKIKSGKNTSKIKISVIVQTWVYSVINITLRYLHIRNPKRKLNSNKLVLSEREKKQCYVLYILSLSDSKPNLIALQDLSQVLEIKNQYEMLGDQIFFSDRIPQNVSTKVGRQFKSFF